MIFASLQLLLLLLFSLVILALAVWALVDALRRPAAAFTAAGKQTKQRWTIILAAAAVIAFIAVPPPLGIAGLPIFLALLSAVAAVVYLVDVRPAVGPHTRRRGPRDGGPSRGGW